MDNYIFDLDDALRPHLNRARRTVDPGREAVEPTALAEQHAEW